MGSMLTGVLTRALYLRIPGLSITRAAISPKMVLIGDANEQSHRGDGDINSSVKDDCSYIDAGEANISGCNGRNGNRFSDRHYGGTNYLYQDLHGEWSTRLRKTLAIRLRFKWRKGCGEPPHNNLPFSC